VRLFLRRRDDAPSQLGLLSTLGWSYWIFRGSAGGIDEKARTSEEQATSVLVLAKSQESSDLNGFRWAAALLLAFGSWAFLHGSGADPSGAVGGGCSARVPSGFRAVDQGGTRGPLAQSLYWGVLRDMERDGQAVLPSRTLVSGSVGFTLPVSAAAGFGRLRRELGRPWSSGCELR